MRVAGAGHDAWYQLADRQLTRAVSIESVLEEQQHLLPHPAVLVAEAGLDPLEQLGRSDRGVHQLAQHDVGLLPDLGPGVSQPVQDAGQDGGEVGFEL